MGAEGGEGLERVPFGRPLSRLLASRREQEAVGDVTFYLNIIN